MTLGKFLPLCERCLLLCKVLLVVVSTAMERPHQMTWGPSTDEWLRIMGELSQMLN